MKPFTVNELPNEIIYNILDKLPLSSLIQIFKSNLAMNEFRPLFKDKIKRFAERLNDDLKVIPIYLEMFYAGLEYVDGNFVLSDDDPFDCIHSYHENKYGHLDDDEFALVSGAERKKYFELYRSINDVITNINLYIHFKNTQTFISLSEELQIFVPEPITPAKILLAFIELYKQSLREPEYFCQYDLGAYGGYDSVRLLKLDEDFNAHIMIV